VGHKGGIVELSFDVRIKIQKPVAEVFDAVVNPAKLTGYFVSSASGPLEEGKVVQWRFAEVDLEFPVTVREVKPNELVCFEWASNEDDYNTTVTMSFEAIDAENTMVSIRESGWRETDKGLDGSYRNCQGWTHMGCCLKAYLDHGINLRKGSI
jgi:uncharacterized protein YndB with AHSA1/START domain